MGADIDMVEGGVWSGAFRTTPWHGVGDSVNGKGEVVGTKVLIPADVRDGRTLFTIAGLDWKVEEATLDTLGVNLERADRFKAIIRTDKNRILGMHSDRYGALQNMDDVSPFVDTILRLRGDAVPASAVELWGGRVLFTVIEFTDLVKVVRADGGEKDKMTRYMGIYWSHDGTHPLSVVYMNHLWVCQNTFTPLRSDSGLVVRHTRNASQIAASALQALERMVQTFDAFDAELEELLDIEYSRSQMVGLAVNLAGDKPEKEGRALTMWENRVDGMIGEWSEYTRQESAFDAIMAVQGYEQHRSTIRNTTRDVASIQRLMRSDFPLTRKAMAMVTA